MNKEDLKYLTEKIPSLTPEEIKNFSDDIEFREFKSGDIYIKQGELNQKLYFVKKGIVRVYMLLENGTEKTILFRSENSFFGNYDGIIFNQKSRFFYQCIGETELFEIDYKHINQLAKTSLSFSNLKSDVLLAMVGSLLKSQEDFVLLSAEERYQKHLEANAIELQRVPSKYLASLLGITPVSLSRIKRRIFKGD